MKRWFAILLLLVLIFTVSCQPKSDTPAPETSPEKTMTEPKEETPAETPTGSGDKEEIVFAVQEDSTPALQELVKAFNEKSKRYSVKTVIMTNDSGQMYDQLLNSLSSKSGEYDVISMDVVWAGTFASAGYLEPLDELMMNNSWTPADFNKGSMDSGKYMGKHYALPYFPDLGFLYVRKDIVSAEDLTKLQSGEYSYQDLLEMAKKYKGEGETKTGYVYQSKQYEGLTVNINEFSNNWADVSGGLKTMKSMMDEGVVPEDILNYDEGATHTAFINGESVFARNWPYMNGMIQAGDQKVKPEQVAYAPLPNGGSVGGWLLGINANGTKKEGAMEFVAFVAGPEGQKINATKGSYLPGVNALLKDKDVLAANALLNDPAFQLALQKTIARPVVADYAKVTDAIQINTHKFLSGNAQLEEASKAIDEALK